MWNEGVFQIKEYEAPMQSNQGTPQAEPNSSSQPFDSENEQ